MRRRIEQSLDTAAYAERRFNESGIEAWRNPQALTVVFPQPPQKVREHWQLASAGGYSHLICMPHIQREQVDRLLADILAAEDSGS